MRKKKRKDMQLLNEINKTAQRYIVLKASSKKLAEELLEWWYS